VSGARIEIVLVAAVAENGVIGRDGRLPWRIKSDMQFFRETTWGKPVVAGRTTYLSFTRRPLPGRTNIVMSRDGALAMPGAIVAPSLDAALQTARADALRRGAAEIMVVGGADIFGQTMAVADRLLITRVHLRPSGDTGFPAIDPAVWAERQRTEHRAAPGDEADFTVLVYHRHTGR